jgi:hypothetical protein
MLRYVVLCYITLRYVIFIKQGRRTASHSSAATTARGATRRPKSGSLESKEGARAPPRAITSVTVDSDDAVDEDTIDNEYIK